ncbi:MAG TPA: hypothetical protein DEG47_11380 [Cyanobacteria bacterium UBA11148]|nr:hypothetical protein [Cyanobacteria bacterium UBA11148]
MTSTLLTTPPLNAPTIKTLPNGLTIVAEQMPVEAVNLNLWINVGSAIESDEINGMAHFLEHMVFKGTRRIKSGEFERLIEERGAITNAATSHDYTHYYITTAPKDFAELVPLQLDVVLNPTIPDDAFERERLVVLEEIRRSEDNPRRRIFRRAFETTFNYLPYRRQVLGPTSVIEQLQPHQMRDFHTQWYQPNAITAVAVGNLPVEQLIEIVSEGFTQEQPFIPNNPKSQIQNPKSKIQNPKSDVAIHWMTRVAQLLREEDLDASSAHLIEAVRLAESLAALRDRPLPGLSELNEATQTVLCFGSHLPMGLIHDKLIVGERLGEVPDETPMVPLQKDLQRLQKRLRMPAAATEKIYELDLRNENDLARSRLLHRLNLLGIRWGETQQTRGTGTFKEKWRVQWQPEFVVKLIEAGIWGNTILDGATAYACDQAQKATELPILTHLLDRVLLADLPDAVSKLMSRLQTEAAVSSDVVHLMEALPSLARILRYGNVRKMDSSVISHVVDGLVTRICIGLVGACSSLDDDAATQMYQRIHQVNGAISLLQNEAYLVSWRQVLIQLSDWQFLHGLLSGYSCRLLLDARVFNTEEAARRMGLVLSTASEPPQAAAWVEGFLKGSGLLLLHDHILWQVLDSWVTQLNEDTFTALLPLLRRTFSTFSPAERRQMGERVRRGESVVVGVEGQELDCDRANGVLPILALILGL